MSERYQYYPLVSTIILHYTVVHTVKSCGLEHMLVAEQVDGQIADREFIPRLTLAVGVCRFLLTAS